MVMVKRNKEKKTRKERGEGWGKTKREYGQCKSVKWLRKKSLESTHAH